MHPALSVIIFTTLSGLGYGLWMWTGTALAFRLGPHDGIVHYTSLILGVLPVVFGLLSSVLHLGKPLRAWRAFGEWRTSWLSREGVLALLTFLPWMLLTWAWIPGNGDFSVWFPWLPLLLALLSLATVVCTAMIYASLKPVPAWRQPGVVPVYVGFALLTGGLTATAWQAVGTWPGDIVVLGLMLLALALGIGKRRYWRRLDRGDMPVDRASALGLPADRVATVFERPHTEANYLTREMGFVLARKHSKRLRVIALVLFALVPAAICGLCLVLPLPAAPMLASAALSALLGAIVERWLFFAEAKHLVMLYY